MTIGILGGGQLGRMLILAGIPLGLKFRVLDPVDGVASTDGLAPRIVGDFESRASLAEFVQGLDAVTYEFENVPVSTARWLSERVPVFPPPQALEVAQDRINEKQFFVEQGIPTPKFVAVNSLEDFEAARIKVGLPAVLKTRRFGYDGKGQAVIRSQAEADAAWKTLGGRPLILEECVPFDREISVIATRAGDGSVAIYPLVQNQHRDGILVKSVALVSDANRAIQNQAEVHIRRVLAALNYVGTLAIEFFDVGGRLLANEMAPRVHNTGHWTIEGAATSQFENHLRAGAGWPLGETIALGSIGMLNFIGSLPKIDDVLAVPGTHWHDYGKLPRAGRKVGHVTITASNEQSLESRLREVERRISLSQ